MHVVIIVILILAIMLVIFTLQNSIEITINAFFWKINDVPLVLVLLVCLLAGYLLAALYLYPRLWKIKKEYKKLIRSNEKLKQLSEMNHPKHEKHTNPEGIALDDDDEENNTFFKD